MKKQNFVMAIFTIVVGIVMVTSVLIPTISNSMDNNNTNLSVKSVTADLVVWAVTTDGKLFGTGDNSSGQQGSGDTTNVTEFTQRLSDQTIKDVVIGSDATWVVTTDGKLFGTGANTYGQQGSGDTTNVTEFTLHDFSDSESSQSGNSETVSTLLSVIPIFVMIGLLVGTIALFIKRQ